MTREGGRGYDKGGRERAGQEGGEIERGNRGRRKERKETWKLKKSCANIIAQHGGSLIVIAHV